MSAEFDVIVIGGGINGLTVAAYLAKCGLNVAVFERRNEVAAHCDTVEITIPGVRHNTCASSIHASYSPCIGDLELEKFGLKFIFSEYSKGIPFRNGRSLLFHVYEPKKTLRTIEKFSTKDAKRFSELTEKIKPFSEEILARTFFTMQSEENVERLYEIMSHVFGLDISDVSAFELLDLLFESEEIKGTIAFQLLDAGFLPWLRGISCIGIPYAIRTINPVGQLKGGSHMLPHSLVKCIHYHGGKVFQACEVEKIIIENNEAKGIILSEYSAFPQRKVFAKKAIVSDLSARLTFLKLIGEEYSDSDIMYRIKHMNYDVSIEFGAFYALKNPPEWKVDDPNMKKAFMGYFGFDSLEDVRKEALEIISGRLPERVNCDWFAPTIVDPTQATKGRHAVTIFTEAPFDLRAKGGPEKWDEISPEFLERITSSWAEFAKNVPKDILCKTYLSPLDYYRANPSAIKGNWAGGTITEDYFVNRPFKGAPRTPIGKFYISNSIWPHGVSNLGSGYITACVVAEDLTVRNQSWWKYKPLQWFKEDFHRLIVMHKKAST